MMRMASASMAMSCVAEANDEHDRATAQKAALAGGTDAERGEATATGRPARRRSRSRYVPIASTSGAQKNFSVQMMPTLPMRPIVAQIDLREREVGVDASR